MRELILAGLLAAVFGQVCFAQAKSGKARVCITEAEYEVYSAAGVGNFQNATVPGGLSEGVAAELPDVSPETVADFREKNRESYLLRCLNKADGKTAKLRKSSGGNASTSFSRVGFGRGGEEALVYDSWSAVGNYCGAEFVLLRKRAGRWEVVKRVTTYIC